MKDIYFSFADLKRLFKKLKPQLKRAALIGATCAFAFLLLKAPPHYKAEASFKQAQNKVEQSNLFKDLFKGFVLNENDTNAKSIMISHRLMRRVVEDLGLQVCLRESLPLRAFKRVGKNIAAELNFSLSDPDPFVFRQVRMDGEHSLPFSLRFLDEENYEVLNGKKETLGCGRLGLPFATGPYAFTLEKTPRHLALAKAYVFTIQPWLGVTSKVLGELDIQPNRRNKNILNLTFFHPDRKIAAQFLNQVMSAYQNFLKEENEMIAEAQLAYLEKRQGELTQQFNQALEEQVAYLRRTLGEDGFIGLDQEVEMLAGPKEQYLTKLFNTDLELKRLQKSEALPLASEQAREARIVLERIQKDEDVPENLSLVQNPKSLVSIWTEQLRASRLKLAKAEGGEKDKVRRELDLKREQFSDYLCQVIYRLDQRATIAAPTFYPKTQGIDLQTAQQLYIEYQRELDALQAKVEQLVFLEGEMQREDFELSALGSVLNDTVSQQLVTQASALTLQLCDENNRSGKDQERIKEALATQKKFIAHHIAHTAGLLELKTHLLQDKIASLQETATELYKGEKILIEEKLAELRQRMSDLPEKWKLEKELEMKKELGTSMIEAIAQLSESKSVDHNLFQVESKPLDEAIPAIKPEHPRLILLSLITAFIAVFGVYAFHLCRGLAIGLPVSLESLRLHGLHTCGSLSALADAPLAKLGAPDLETLRRMTAFITAKKEKGVCTALIGGKLPDYSHALAELFAIKGAKVLLIQCAFDAALPRAQGMGLCPYLEGKIEQCPIERKSSYDYLPTAGNSRHAAELLASSRFADLLAQSMGKYDVTLIFSRALPPSAEAQIFLKEADQVIVSLQEETLDELSPFMAWAREKEGAPLAFINCLF